MEANKRKVEEHNAVHKNKHQDVDLSNEKKMILCFAQRNTYIHGGNFLLFFVILRLTLPLIGPEDALSDATRKPKKD
jgi:hypothetical protein